MELELLLRITILHPPRDVTFRLLRGKAELVSPSEMKDELLSFDCTVRVVDNRSDNSPNFLGPFTHGPPSRRHLSVLSGTLAGQADSCWTRGAKVLLSGMTWSQIQAVQAAPGSVLEARIAGTAKDGGPACATVPLLDGGWKVVH